MSKANTPGNAPETTGETSSSDTREIIEGAQRMSGFDFATWRSAGDPVMRATMIGLMLLEKEPDWNLLVARYDRASRINPVLRKKVVEGPLPLVTPRLIIDPNFDLSYHLRRFDMPDGTTWNDVLLEARRQSMTGFDLDRPLWQISVFNNLPDGRSVMVMKLHHAIADGQGAMLLGASLFDFTAEGQDLGPMPPEPTGESLDTVGVTEASLKHQAQWYAKSVQEFATGFPPATAKALRHPRKTIKKLLTAVGSVAKVANLPLGPLSPLMTERSINYHFGTFDVPFAEMKSVAKASGHTVNDLFLTAVAEGMARFHTAEGRPVDRLRINMPISLRTSSDSIANAVTIVRFEMPVADSGARKLMDEIGAIALKWRQEPALRWTDTLAEFSRVLPIELLAAAAQASDVTASNVPGVPIPVWLAGAQVLRMYPLVSTIGAAVNITMLTYNGTASVGVSADDAAVIDNDLLMRCLREGFADVAQAPVSAISPVGGSMDPDAPAPVVVKPRARKTVSKKAAPRKAAPRKAAPRKAAPRKSPSAG